MDVVLDNFMEELGGERTHVDIMLQFLEEAGISRRPVPPARPATGALRRENGRAAPTRLRGTASR
jgi:hypothetical protein